MEDLLTLEDLKAMEPANIIAQGITTNNPEGIYMTDTRKGDRLKWIAKRGQIHDWAIYVHWEDKSDQYVLDYGQKVMDLENVKKLINANEEALKKYRR